MRVSRMSLVTAMGGLVFGVLLFALSAGGGRVVAKCTFVEYQTNNGRVYACLQLTNSSAHSLSCEGSRNSPLLEFDSSNWYCRMDMQAATIIASQTPIVIPPSKTLDFRVHMFTNQVWKAGENGVSS